MLDGLPSQNFYQPEKSPNIPILPGERRQYLFWLRLKLYHSKDQINWPFLSSGCDNYYNGEVMPCLMRPWLPPFSYSTTEVRSAGQRTHVLMFLCFPQLVVTTLIRRATTGSTRGRGGQQGPGELCSRAQGQASSARFLISLKSHRDTQIHCRIRHLKSNFRI